MGRSASTGDRVPARRRPSLGRNASRAACRAYRQRWTFQSEGVGLLAVDDRGRVRSPILAAPSPRLLPFVREKVLESCRTDPLLFHSPDEARTLVGARVDAPDAWSGDVPSCRPALARVSESE